MPMSMPNRMILNPSGSGGTTIYKGREEMSGGQPEMSGGQPELVGKIGEKWAIPIRDTWARENSSYSFRVNRQREVKCVTRSPIGRGMTTRIERNDPGSNDL